MSRGKSSLEEEAGGWSERGRPRRACLTTPRSRPTRPIRPSRALAIRRALGLNPSPKRARLDSVLALLRVLPAASRWGVALTVAGLGIDLVVHVGGGEATTGTAAAIGHLLTLLGMVVAVAGVMWLGLRGSLGGPARERRG
jgi:hypothetical protein